MEEVLAHQRTAQFSVVHAAGCFLPKTVSKFKPAKSGSTDLFVCGQRERLYGLEPFP